MVLPSKRRNSRLLNSNKKIVTFLIHSKIHFIFNKISNLVKPF